MKNQKELLLELLELALTIQEKGIAEVFFDYAGHVNAYHVRLFSPVWDDNQEPTYKVGRYSITPEQIQETIEALKILSEEGIEAITKLTKSQLRDVA